MTETHEHHTTVIIQDALGDPEYTLMFDLNQDKELANRFVRAVSNQAVVSHIIHEKKVCCRVERHGIEAVLPLL